MMFPFLETALGFLAIMLALSLLVKSLTSLIKDHFDFYTDNIRYEVNRLVRNTLGKTVEQLTQDPQVVARAPFLTDVNWERVGDEVFNRENAAWVLTQLGATPEQLAHLDGRLVYHLGRVRYAFERRVKNLSFASGLALCLALDINAFSIWNTLYNDSKLRAFFAGDNATAVLAAASRPPDQATPPTEDSLQQAREEFNKDLTTFLGDVDFGVGRIWRGGEQGINDAWTFLVEFLGAALTGLLVSVGAPYWHDVLNNLSAFRPRKT